jgi:hypothetical protein
MRTYTMPSKSVILVVIPLVVVALVFSMSASILGNIVFTETIVTAPECHSSSTQQ